MADWLAHREALQAGLLLASIAGVLVWETWRPRRSLAVPLGGRWFNQVALTALGSLVVRLSAPLAALGLAVMAQEQGWGLLNLIALPAWLSLMIGVIAIDLNTYLQHRLFHAMPLLWRFHKIHHCDLDVDCGTALRHHPVETIVTQVFDLALIVAVGVSPLAVLVALTLGGMVSVFNHANIALPKAADRALRWLVVTPDMHRIHHSVDVEESNRNFANLLPWWDRLFSTYRREPLLGQTQMVVGLAEARADRDFSLWSLLALPFRRRRADVPFETRLGNYEVSQ